jgi:hypothetical protein
MTYQKLDLVRDSFADAEAVAERTRLELRNFDDSLLSFGALSSNKTKGDAGRTIKYCIINGRLGEDSCR